MCITLNVADKILKRSCFFSELDLKRNVSKHRILICLLKRNVQTIKKFTNSQEKAERRFFRIFQKKVKKKRKIMRKIPTQGKGTFVKHLKV